MDTPLGKAIVVIYIVAILVIFFVLRIVSNVSRVSEGTKGKTKEYIFVDPDVDTELGEEHALLAETPEEEEEALFF